MSFVAWALALVACVHAHGRSVVEPEITWDAPPQCGTQTAVQEGVRRHLGDSAITDAAAPGPIVARVRPLDDRFELVVTFADDRGERRLVVDTCDAAVRAAAFVVAITIDPQLMSSDDAPSVVVPVPNTTEAPTDATSTTGATEPPPRATSPVIVAPPPSTPPPTIAARGLVQAGAAAHVGILPTPTAGFLAGAGVAWPRARLVVGYVRWFPSRTRLAARPSVGAELSVHAATATAGPVFRFDTIELPLRAGVELGRLSAAGFGTDRDHVAHSTWLALTLGTGFHWVPKALRGHGALVVQIDGAAAPLRPRVVVDDGQTLFPLGAFGFRAALLLEGRFP
jgi:hypothetical protein